MTAGSSSSRHKVLVVRVHYTGRGSLFLAVGGDSYLAYMNSTALNLVSCLASSGIVFSVIWGSQRACAKDMGSVCMQNQGSLIIDHWFIAGIAGIIYLKYPRTLAAYLTLRSLTDMIRYKYIKSPERH